MKLKIIYEPKGRAREYSPLALNLYRGCEHRCTYCYGPDVLHMDRREFYEESKPRKRAITNIVKDAEQLKDAGDLRPILLCFVCDPYPPGDSRLTRDAIAVLKSYDRRLQILTKGGLRATRDLDLLDGADTFATTLTFCNIADSLYWEPRAATPAERLISLYKAKQRGLTTWVSMEPVISTEQSLALIQMSLDRVDLYKLGAWNYDVRARAIDWSRYYHRAIEIIGAAGREVFVKDDLKKLVGGAK